MKINKLLSRGFLAALLVLFAPALLSAAPPSADGLTVSLYLGVDLSGQTTTHDGGVFLLEGVAAEAYELVITDTDATMNLRFKVEVTAEQAPAQIAGQVTSYADSDIGVKVLARIIGADEGGSVAIENAALHPRKWNRNYAYSMGTVKVVLWGTSLDAVSMVTLQNGNGSVSSADIRYDTSEGVAVVFFGKAPAYAALVPADALRGDAVQVDIVVEAPGFSQTFSKEVIILGRHHRP